jgi:hypothetical protein
LLSGEFPLSSRRVLACIRTAAVAAQDEAACFHSPPCLKGDRNFPRRAIAASKGSP